MYNQLITESMCIKIIPNHHNLAVSCLYISYMLFIFEYKIRVSSLIVLTSLCLNWCLNQRKIGRVRYKKICLYVAVNQFLMQHWRCTWKNVAHLLWEQRVAGSNPVTPTDRQPREWLFFYLNKKLIFVPINLILTRMKMSK